MNFLIDNWLALVSLISSPLGIAIGWVLGGRAAKAQELKKGSVEIDTAEIDYAVKVRELYESLLAQANLDKEALKSDKDAIVAEFKEEKEYFRSKVDSLREELTGLQSQFNTMQLAYTKEVEQSQNWEKLHRELLEKYNALKDLYDKLKEDFDKHKKLKS
jgi:chromosome segregation ATPase